MMINNILCFCLFHVQSLALSEFQEFELFDVHCLLKCEQIQNVQMHNFQTTWPGFCLGAPKRKVVTKQILYKMYREIISQKVALGYLLHFVQNGSSTKRTKECFLHTNIKKLKIWEVALYIPR